MTDATADAIPFGDALTAPFWEAAREHRLLLQRCSSCRRHQFYPRPFCIRCGSDDVEWVEASGMGTVYSRTTVRRKVVPHFDPPYDIALVELDEGTRFLGHLTGPRCPIGGRVRVTWQARDEAPPLPAFHQVEGSDNQEESRGQA